MYALWAKDSGRAKDPLCRLDGVAYLMGFEGALKELGVIYRQGERGGTGYIQHET
jgi:hypothetical protein